MVERYEAKKLIMGAQPDFPASCEDILGIFEKLAETARHADAWKIGYKKHSLSGGGVKHR